MVRCWREPYIHVEPNLMTRMACKHRTTARLGQVANQDAIPANLLGAVGEPFDECDEAWIARKRPLGPTFISAC